MARIVAVEETDESRFLHMDIPSTSFGYDRLEIAQELSPTKATHFDTLRLKECLSFWT